MVKRSFGMAAKKLDGQLDLFAPLPEPMPVVPAVVLDPSDLVGQLYAHLRLYAVAPPEDGTIPCYGLFTGLSRVSWMHTFVLQMYEGRVYVVHPAFDDAPWLDGVAEALGYRPVYAECMAVSRRETEARFASDFCSKTGWRELLDNRHLTTPRDILNEVASGMHRYRCDDGIDFRIARTLMLEIGSADPGVGAFTEDQMVSAVCEQVFFKARNFEDLTWQRIHAWELGLVRFRKGLAEPTIGWKTAA